MPQTPQILKKSQEESSYVEIMLGHPNQDTQTEGQQKILELLWNTNEDTLVFLFRHLIKLAKELPATKHSVIKVPVFMIPLDSSHHSSSQ